MRTTTRARHIALALLAAVAGSASVGVAALARAGVCLHRLGLFGLHAPAAPGAMDAPGMAGMPGMAATAPMAMTPAAPCPILIGVALFGAFCYLAALAALIAVRPSPREVALTSARVVCGIRFAPLAALITLVGAVPVGALILADGVPAPGGIAIAAVFLTAAALAAAGVLIAIARVVIACARRIVVALLAALHVSLQESGAPLRRRQHLVPVSAGVLIARRRPSRAPPVRGCS
jgi:hypothetical protein